MNKRLVGLLTTATVFVGIGLYVFFGSATKEDGFNPEFEEDQVRIVQDSQATQGIRMPGYEKLYFPVGEKVVDVDFFNPEENEVYFEISLYLTEEDKVIYKSKLLSPGQHLYSIELEEILDKGTYDIDIIYSTYSMDDSYTPKNGGKVSCDLVVE